MVVFDLCFKGSYNYVIYKRFTIFGILLYKQKIAKFSNIEEAVKFLKKQ